MKTNYIAIAHLIILLMAQTFGYSQTNTTKIVVPKTLKEEKIKTHGDKTTYLITLKDGNKEKICQSTDGTWWIHMALTSDKGPYTKAEALQKAYEIDVKGSAGAEKTGAALGAMLTKDKKIYTDQYGNKYYIQDGKRVYVK